MLWCGNRPLTSTVTRQTQVRIRNKLSVRFFRYFLTSVQRSASLCEVPLVMPAAPTFPISLASHDAVRRRRLGTMTASQSEAVKQRSHFHRKSCRNQRESAGLTTIALFWRKRRKYEHERQGFASEGQLHSTIFPVLNQRERDHLVELGVDQRMILECIFNKQDEGWTGLIWLWIGTDGGHL